MAHPLEVRCTAEKHSWIEAITMEKTNSLEIEIPYRTAQEKATLYRKWDNIVDKKICNVAHAYPGIDATLNSTFGHETICLINLMPDHRNQIQSYIDQNTSDVYSNQQKVIEASTILASSNVEVKDLKDNNTVEFAKTLLVKEIIMNSGKEATSSISPLLEKVSCEMRQEPQRIYLLHERNQLQHLQRNQQLSL